MGFLEIILAIASLVGGEYAVSYLAVTGWQAAAVRFAVALAISTASRNLVTRKSFQSEAEGRIITTKEPLASAKVVYGQVRVGGTIVFMETTSTSNEYLHLVIALTGHEVHAIDDIYFDDEVVPLDGSGNATGTFADYVRIKKALGTDAQTAFSDLVSESNSLWTSNHRLRGRAAIYVRLKYNQDKFPNGVPNITAIVRGKKVYDPRTATTVYSTNPALILADYLCNTRYGLNATYATEIDETALIAAANVCDEDVTLAAGGTEDRYTANGSFDTTEVPEKIISEICSAMAGYTTYVGGKWVILAGDYRTPTITLDEDDLRAGFKVQTLTSRRDQFNSVKGVFASPDNLWQPTDFPAYESASFIAEDNNETVYRDISLPYTTSVATAQRLAKIELYKAREQISLTLPCKLTAYGVQVGDVINLTNARLGWSAKAFEVVGTKISFDIDQGFGVDLDLRETNSAIWDWNQATEEQSYTPAPNTNLPNPRTVGAPSGLTLTQIQLVLKDGTYANAIRCNWTAPSDQFIKHYEFTYQRTGGSLDYGFVTATANQSFDYGAVITAASISDDFGLVTGEIISGEPEFNSITTSQTYLTIAPIVENVTYTVKVRAVSHLDVRSAYTQDTIITDPDETAPGVVTNLAATGAYKTIQLTWDNPTDTDFFYCEVYEHTSNTRASATLIAKVSTDSFARSGLGANVTRYYWLRAVDFTGNRSEFNAVNGVSATTDVEAASSLDLADKLSKSSANILTGTIVPEDSGGIKVGTIAWNSTTGAITSGSGIAITEYGLIGAKTGSATFTIDTNGDATFAGTVAAGSIITNSVTVDGVTLGTTTTKAANALASADFNVTLQNKLNSGVANIIAGVGSNYQLDIDTTSAFILVGHKDAVYNGTATSGSVKPALGISSAGIAMGYNRSSDGAWINSVAIDSSGNASFAGELSAATGTFAGSLSAVSGSFTGQLTTGSSGSFRIEINKSSSNRIDVYNASNERIGYFGGTGVATSGVLYLYPRLVSTGSQDEAYAGVIDLPAIDLTGTKVVYGLRSGTVSGTSLRADLVHWSNNGTAWGLRGIYSDYEGFLGYKTSSITAAGRFTVSTVGGAEARLATSAGYAVHIVSGDFRFGSYTIAAPGGSTTTFLRNDGTWATPSVGSLANAVTFNNSGTGAASGTTFDGSVARTISYNTIGAPSTSGTNATGTWAISISGNAATATSATSATSATTATNVSGTVAIANGGTGQTSQTSAFDALAPTTTKGDLIVSNGSDNVRIAVGTNDYVLMAASGEATGVKWAKSQKLFGTGGGGNVLTFTQGTLTGTATGTYVGNNKPGSNSNNVWLEIVIDSTTLYIPCWT